MVTLDAHAPKSLNPSNNKFKNVAYVFFTQSLKITANTF